MVDIRLPGNSDRLVVIGRTGTGKTQAGLWHLSLKNFKTFPFVMVDAKGDSLINEISNMPGVERVGFNDKIGRSGLYHLKATPPDMKSAAMTDFLWRIHKRGRCGLFLDETFVFGRQPTALETIYTQGRSLNLPTISLTQRPSWISQFCFSEAGYFQCFDLNTRVDQKKVEEFVPVDMQSHLPDYHSRWYDVGRNQVARFSPVPPRDEILDNFEFSLRPKRVIL